MKDKKNTPQVLARRALLVLLDAAIVAFSFYFALLLRADGAVEATWWPHNRELLYENLPWIVAVYIASFLFSGLYSVLWKYAGERDLMRLAGTVAVPTSPIPPATASGPMDSEGTPVISGFSRSLTLEVVSADTYAAHTSAIDNRNFFIIFFLLLILSIALRLCGYSYNECCAVLLFFDHQF